jgi:phosphoribosyl 1,2-cyclic phosphodiesterase
MIDCGSDWLEKLSQLEPDALLLSHPHPDHSAGLAMGAPCPVYATAASWQGLPDYPLTDRRQLTLDQPLDIHGLLIQAVPLHHSLRAPASGLRIQAGNTCLFYAPDVAALAEPSALQGVDLYIGDGSTLNASLLRREQGQACGHAPISEQLQWCHTAGITKVIITHCGEAIIADETTATRMLTDLANSLNIKLNIAYDGQRLSFN